MKDYNIGKLIMEPPKGVSIIDISVFEKGFILTLRKKTNARSPLYPYKPLPDFVWREVYSLDGDGNLKLVESRVGTHILEETIPEHFVFEA